MRIRWWRSFCIALFLLFPLDGARGYVGEELGFDLYRTIDIGLPALENRLIIRRLEWSGAKINTLVGRACRDYRGEQIFCLIEQDYTVTEIEAIADNRLKPILLRLRSEALDGFNTEVFGEDMLNRIRKYIDALIEDARAERRGIEMFGTIGLFTDGDIENSGYDLIDDLEKINAVLFSDAPEYDGISNANALHLGSILDIGEFFDGEDNEIEGIFSRDAETRYEGVSLSDAVVDDTVSCAPEGAYDIGVLDSWNIFDPTSDSGGFDGVATVERRWSEGSEFGWFPTGGDDSFPCSGSQIFCIEIEFVMYDQMLLDYGGADDSIEGIVDHTLEILNEYAPTSFAQARMTNNFFELSLKDLDLPSMVHIGVVVSRKTPPILNLEAWQDESEENAREASDAFEATFERTFRMYGLEYSRQNMLSNPCVDYELTLLYEGTTERENKIRNERCKPGWTQHEAYPEIESEKMKDEYYQHFSGDLQQFATNMSTLAASIRQMIGVIKWVNEIPNTR